MGRCHDPATVQLIDQEGQKNPGSYLCHHHAQLVVEEYREKLSLRWSTTPLADLGVFRCNHWVVEGDAPRGVELKPEYFREAVKHCEDAVSSTHHQLNLLDDE